MHENTTKTIEEIEKYRFKFLKSNSFNFFKSGFLPIVLQHNFKNKPFFNDCYTTSNSFIKCIFIFMTSFIKK